MFIGNKGGEILLNIHQNIIPQNIIFQFDVPMYSPIPSKNKTKTLSKLPKLTTTLQGYVKAHLPPTVEQPLD